MSTYLSLVLHEVGEADLFALFDEPVEVPIHNLHDGLNRLAHVLLRHLLIVDSDSGRNVVHILD